MDALIIEKTTETPEINFNPNTGVLKIYGRAYSNDISLFYKKLEFWITDYIAHPQPTTVLELHLEYCNSVFNKLLLIFIEKCKTIVTDEQKLIINWLHEKDDKESMDDANRISRIISYPIEKIEVE